MSDLQRILNRLRSGDEFARVELAEALTNLVDRDMLEFAIDKLEHNAIIAADVPRYLATLRVPNETE